MKTIKKLFPILMSAVMLFSMCIPAFAADGNYTEAFDVEGATLSIPVYVVMDKYANVPDISFDFNIAAGQADDGVVAGVDASSVDVTVPNMNSSTPTITKTEASSLADVYKAMPDDTKAAYVTATVDFSNVAFEMPGVYRYVLTSDFTGDTSETSHTQTYVLDVYVVNNDGYNGLTIQDILVYQQGTDSLGAKLENIIFGAGTKDPTNPDDPDNPDPDPNDPDTPFNGYETYDVDLTKLIAGNQADMNKKFDFTITIHDVTNSFTITAGGQDTTTIPSRNTDNTEALVVQLGHNETAIIHALPYNTKVTISEVNGDYVATYKIDEGQSNEGATLSNHAVTSDTSVEFTNTKTGVIPTGVFLAVGPMVGIAAIGGIGMMVSKKRKDEDED